MPGKSLFLMIVIDPLADATLVERTQHRLKEKLGPHAYKAMQLSMKKSEIKKQ